MEKFIIEKKCRDTKARVGRIITAYGEVETPVFMPVGTQGTVKAVSNSELRDIGVQLFISNTYHLYIRPGMDVIKNAGGLHKFINWDRAIITDSGGFQLHSLAKYCKVNNEGAEFKSHIDGSTHFFTPEKVIEIQNHLGSDIMMCFDECTSYPCSRDYAEQSMELTFRWAKRCKKFFLDTHPVDTEQQVFGIVQGSTYLDLRRTSVQELTDVGFDGYALGGLSVGEPKEIMDEIITEIVPFLPEDKPRYVMGVGTPEDIWTCIENGVDMFDCVIPTKNGRNGQALTSSGKLNLKNAVHKNDYSPLDSECPCEVCREYTKAYIHHLFRSGELLALRLLSLHNLYFLIQLVGSIKKSIRSGKFVSEKKKFFENYGKL